MIIKYASQAAELARYVNFPVLAIWMEDEKPRCVVRADNAADLDHYVETMMLASPRSHIVLTGMSGEGVEIG